MSGPLPHCRKCGCLPLVVRNHDITPGQPSWAIHCSDFAHCYNDTHWQQSFAAAAAIWQRNPCHHERGGQGDPNDDRQTVVQ